MRFSHALSCLVTLAFAASLSIGSATAQEKPNVRIGLVDMERIFGEFYKTKLAEAEVEETKEVIKGEVEERAKTHKRVVGEFDEIYKKMQDPTLAEAVRKKHQAAAQAKKAEINTLDTEMKEYSERRRRQLIEQVEKSKAGILNEISKKIQEISKADGFDVVFDRSGLSERGFPFVVFVAEDNDLTEKIIKNLNANAPKTASPAPAEKPK